MVAFLGAVVAFAANALSPRGLKLSRNYFPGDHGPNIKPSGIAIEGGSTNVAPVTAAQAAAVRLQQKGFQTIDGPKVESLYQDPRYAQGFTIFIDARDDQHYQQGHIPGAYQFYHYQWQNYLAEVLPACQLAQQIVVYCKGGDCEDSEFAATMLKESLQVPSEKLFVYLEGITDWQARGRPIEIGARKSGQIQNVKR